KQKVKISERTINKKKERIRKYTIALEKRFDKLSKPYVEKYFTKIRRDIQRLFYLERNRAVPPKQIIDKEWGQDQNIKKRVFKYISKKLLSKKETKVLLNYFQNIETKTIQRPSA